MQPPEREKMTEIEIEQAKKLREQGKTYREIADIMCYSRAAIYYNVGHKVRKDAEIYNQIIYKGLYDYFEEHKDITIYRFSCMIFGYAKSNVYYLLVRMFKGQDIRLPLSVIQKMVEVTGKSFEELFEKRKGF